MTQEGSGEGLSSVRALAAHESLAFESGIGKNDSLAQSRIALSQITWNDIKEKVFGCPSSPVYDGAMKEVIGRFYDQGKVKVLSEQLGKHNCEIKSDDQAVEIANKVLEAIEDPFTRVLKKSEVDEMNKAIRGETSLTGIGIVVGLDKPDAKTEARPKAQMVFPGTPAQKAGLRNGDIILQVDGKDTKGMSMEDVTGLIRGQLSDQAAILRHNGIPVSQITRTTYSLGDRPLVLLVDEYSASASELIAGALKDNRAAIVVGEKTFGKGIGQRMIPGANGTMVLVTDTKYTSPNGTWAGNGDKQKNGITPHVDVPLGDVYIPLSDQDTQFKRAMEIIRSKVDKK